MARIIPIVIAVVAIAALTVVEGRITERWGDNRLCAYCATLLDGVPKEIGDWVGEDLTVEEVIQTGAGARGYVSRRYRNEATEQSVGVWLIVGHARDTAGHTPDVCYPASGYENLGLGRHELETPDGAKASFFTAAFTKQETLGSVRERAYWTWFKPAPRSAAPVQWRAIDNIRVSLGAAPALYKLYFTTTEGSDPTDHNAGPCMEFAKEFLPKIAPILAPANGEVPADFDASKVKEV